MVRLTRFEIWRQIHRSWILSGSITAGQATQLPAVGPIAPASQGRIHTTKEWLPRIARAQWNSEGVIGQIICIAACLITSRAAFRRALRSWRHGGSATDNPPFLWQGRTRGSRPFWEA